MVEVIIYAYCMRCSATFREKHSNVMKTVPGWKLVVERGGNNNLFLEKLRATQWLYTERKYWIILISMSF
jgi:hypothetical protein